ncbi:IS110 family transposase, partial [Aquimarina mytili]
MKTNSKFIGIDVSKKTLDICILSDRKEFFKIDNTPQSIEEFFTGNLSKKTTHYVCIENTGKYGWALMKLMPEFNCLFYVVN